MITLLFANGATSSLASGINTTATTIQLAAGSGVLFPQPVPTVSYFVATLVDQATRTISEIIQVTNRVGDILTVVRAQEGTTAKTWLAGDFCNNQLTAGQMGAFTQGGINIGSNNIVYYAVDTGIVNAITIPTPSPLLPGGAPVNGMVFDLIPAVTNTGATTAVIEGNGPYPVHDILDQPLVGGTLIAGKPTLAMYQNSVLYLAHLNNNYLRLSGGTLTGNLTVATPSTPGPQLTLNKNVTTGGSNSLFGQTNAVNRWQMCLGDTIDESGSGAGSNFDIIRYNDSGTIVDVPMSIQRYDALINFNTQVNVNGNLARNPINRGDAVVYLNKITGTWNSSLLGGVNATARWQLSVGDQAPETGGNAGSNFSITSYNDSGASPTVLMSISRSTGVATFTNAIVNGPSDRQLKQNIVPVPSALEKVTNLLGINYNFVGSSQLEIGLIAQDVNTVVPEAVRSETYTSDIPFRLNGVEYTGPIMSVQYDRLVALLIEAVKELKSEVDTLSATVTTLSAKLPS